MRMDTPVTLTRERTVSGTGSKPEIIDTLETFCRLEQVGSATYWGGEAVKIKLEKTIVLWKWQTEGFTHAIVGSIRYKIHNMGKAKDPRQVKLNLIRG